MTHEETFDLQLAKECARSFAGACGVGCTVSDASGRCLFETGYGCASCRICHIAGREEADCIRIERSKELLRHKNIRLTDIAQLVGFEDQSYFTKVFKKLVGVPPLQYRNSKDWGTAD